MKYAWIETQRRSFPLLVLCDALSVSQSGFRAWRRGGIPDRKRLTDAQALVLIRTVHQEVRQAYGARRIHAELRGRGYRIGLPRIERLMRENGIQVEQTRVGDRYVLEAMAQNGFTLGGEQSGHVIISEYANTGDGVLTGLHVAARVARCGRSLAELASVMTTLPQVMINVPNVDKMRAGIDPEIIRAVTQANNMLGTSGRVVLRPSGTEPLVRVMVEAATTQDAQHVAEQLAEVVANRLTL